MDDVAHSSLSDQIAAALDWWREAGVDGDLCDEPQRWVVPEEPVKADEVEQAPRVAAATPAATPPPPPVDRGTWPQDLGTFAQWWLADPWLDGGRVTSRVPPRGPRGAELMILVPEPERTDDAVLLSGPQGRLLGAMLAAMGIAPDAAYVASVLPRVMPHADWNAVAARGLGDLACHHVALAAPKRLLVFGSSILPLLGHDPANISAASTEFKQEGVNVPMLAARDLAVLLEKPRWKAGFWRNWLDWTGTT